MRIVASAALLLLTALPWVAAVSVRSGTTRQTEVTAEGATGGADKAVDVGTVVLAPGGIKTSRISLGGLHFSSIPSAEELRKLLHTALDNGITLLDLADIYSYMGSAKLVGEAFALEPGLREKFQINYKSGIVFPEQPQHLDSSREYLFRAVDIALTQLKTTYIDILMPHAFDPLTNATEVAEAFKDLKAAGKVKYFGLSNTSPSQVELMKAALEKVGPDLVLTTVEMEISVLTPTSLFDGRLDQLQRLDIVPLGWGPLGGDPLSGDNRLFNFDGPIQLRIREALQAVAKELGPDVTEDQVAVAWLLRHPSRIVPILGTTKSWRLEKQAQAVNLKLSRSQWTRILGASATADYSRWEQMHSGQWHDVANDLPNVYGTRLGDNPPVGFCDFSACKKP